VKQAIIKGFSVVAAVLAVAGSGYSYAKLSTDNKLLEIEVSRLEERVDDLRAANEAEAASLMEAHKLQILAQKEEATNFNLNIDRLKNDHSNELAALRAEHARQLDNERATVREQAMAEAARAAEAEERMLAPLSLLVAVIENSKLLDDLTPEVASAVKSASEAVPEPLVEEAKARLPASVRLTEGPKCIEPSAMFEVKLFGYLEVCDQELSVSITKVTGNQPPFVEYSVNGRGARIYHGNVQDLGEGCALEYLTARREGTRQIPVMRLRCDG
jgi:hypothetical protein